MKFLKSIALLLGLFLCSPKAAMGCTCVEGALVDFLTQLDSILFNASLGNRSSANFVVVKGIVTGVTLNHYGVFFKPLHYYYHTTEKDPVIIWGTDGTDCRLSNSAISPPLADTVILLMHRITQRNSVEDTTDFEINKCGTYYLTIRNDSVFGGFDSGFTVHGFPLSRFEDSLNQLIHTLKVESRPEIGFGAKLFPNPLTAVDAIQVRGVFDEEIRITICDMTGEIVTVISEPGRGHEEQTLSIPLNGIVNGFYSLEIISASRRQNLMFSVAKR